MHSPTRPSDGLPPKPRFFEMRIAALFAAVILPMGFLLPFLPLWLEESGFSAEQIGVILAAQMLLRVVTTPVLSAYADRQSDRAPLFVLTVAGAFLFSLGYLLQPTFALVLAVSLALAVVQPLHTTLTDSLAVSGVRRYGSDYSRMRIWGSIAYLTSNVLGGMTLSRWGSGLLPWLYAGSMAAALACVLLATPRLGRPRRAHAANPVEGASLLRNPFFVLIVLAAASLQASHALVYGFASIYWRSIGLSEAVVGWLWAAGTLAEVLMFAAFPRLFGRATPARVMTVAACAALLRWIAMPLIEPLGIGAAGFFATQCLHALSTGLVIIGLQAMMAETVPEDRTSGAQGISFFCNNLGLGLATLLAGRLYEQLGVQAFWAMAGLAVVALVLAIAAARAYPQRAGSGGQTREPS